MLNFRSQSFFKWIVDQFNSLTSDAFLLDRYNHTGTQEASTISDFATSADARITNARGANNGIAPLDSGGKVPAANLPSYVDDVLEYANFAALPGTGETGKIYVLATPYTSGGITSSQFRWTGSAYAPIIASPGSTDSVTEGSTNLYFTAARVLASVLTGLSTASSAVVSATDTVLQAIGKLQGQSTALASRVTALENWRTATGIKRCERFNQTTNGSGDITITFGTAVSNVNKVAFTMDGVYSGTDHPLHYSIRSLSTTGATIRIYRSATLLVLGTTVAAVGSLPVNVTMIEFE